MNIYQVYIIGRNWSDQKVHAIPYHVDYGSATYTRTLSVYEKSIVRATHVPLLKIGTTADAGLHDRVATSVLASCR